MVVSRLIEGEYFQLIRCFPVITIQKSKLNKKEFLDCIDRATLLFVREGEKKPIIIEITDGKMELRLILQWVP